MGQIVNKLQDCGGSVAEALGGRRKRRRSTDSNNSASKQKQGPKKKKLLSTTQYIYKELFKEQKNSDVAVMALDKVWHLHKVYLSQSPYFYTMFNGSWKEATQDFVHIKMLDDCITVQSLDAVFGSFYSDEIEIEPKAVVSVLATATLFHMDSIIVKCAEVMMANIQGDTAVQYYEASYRYGMQTVRKATFQWLKMNLLSVYNRKPKLLRHISIELMTALTGSDDLYVMQTEFSLYSLLRQWMFLRLHPNHDLDDPEVQLKVQQLQFRLFDEGVPFPRGDIVQWAYFADRSSDRSFLATPEGQPYVRTFQKLRTQYLTNHYMDLKIIFNDNIIPCEWIDRHITSHWNALLRIDLNDNFGPANIDDEQFNKHSMRYGRILHESGYCKWRWTGFNFGLDLVLILDSRRLHVSRHHRPEHERVLTFQDKRQFMIRVTVTSINSKRQPIFTQTSEVQTIILTKSGEAELMELDAKLSYPMLVSVNMLVVPPANLSFKAIVPGNDEYDMNIAAAATPISEIGADCERSETPPSSNDSALYLSEPTTSTPSSSTTATMTSTAPMRPSWAPAIETNRTPPSSCSSDEAVVE